MVIYASDLVIERLADFEATGAILTTPAAKEGFCQLAEQMRIESGGGRTTKGSLTAVLFGVPRSPKAEL